MTDDRMTLIEFVEKEADADLVREMLAFAAERIMDAEVESVTGAAKHVRAARRAALATMRSSVFSRAQSTINHCSLVVAVTTFPCHRYHRSVSAGRLNSTGKPEKPSICSRPFTAFSTC